MLDIQKEVKLDVFFHFSGNFGYAQRTPVWTFSGYKIDMFHISCCIVLRFLVVLLLEPRFNFYFVLVIVNFFQHMQYSNIQHINRCFYIEPTKFKGTGVFRIKTSFGSFNVKSVDG